MFIITTVRKINNNYLVQTFVGKYSHNRRTWPGGSETSISLYFASLSIYNVFFPSIHRPPDLNIQILNRIQLDCCLNFLVFLLKLSCDNKALYFAISRHLELLISDENDAFLLLSTEKLLGLIEREKRVDLMLNLQGDKIEFIFCYSNLFDLSPRYTCVQTLVFLFPSDSTSSSYQFTYSQHKQLLLLLLVWQLILWKETVPDSQKSPVWMWPILRKRSELQ